MANGKRGGSGLTKDGDDGDEEPEIPTFNTDPVEIARRPMKGLPKRGGPRPATPALPPPGPSNGTADIPKFTPFSGFGPAAVPTKPPTPAFSFGPSIKKPEVTTEASTPSTPFTPTHVPATGMPSFPAFTPPIHSTTSYRYPKFPTFKPTATTIPTPTPASQSTSKPVSVPTFAPGAAPSPPAAAPSDEPARSGDELFEYYKSLRGLNHSMLKSLQDAIAKDAFADLGKVLASALGDYGKHRGAIETTLGGKKPDAVAAKDPAPTPAAPPVFKLPAAPATTGGFTFAGKPIVASMTSTQPAPAGFVPSIPAGNAENGAETKTIASETLWHTTSTVTDGNGKSTTTTSNNFEDAKEGEPYTKVIKTPSGTVTTTFSSHTTTSAPKDDSSEKDKAIVPPATSATTTTAKQTTLPFSIQKSKSPPAVAPNPPAPTLTPKSPVTKPVEVKTLNFASTKKTEGLTAKAPEEAAKETESKPETSKPITFGGFGAPKGAFGFGGSKLADTAAATNTAPTSASAFAGFGSTTFGSKPAGGAEGLSAAPSTSPFSFGPPKSDAPAAADARPPPLTFGFAAPTTPAGDKPPAFSFGTGNSAFGAGTGKPSAFGAPSTFGGFGAAGTSPFGKAAGVGFGFGGVTKPQEPAEAEAEATTETGPSGEDNSQDVEGAGEEDEENVFSVKGKLYRFDDGAWAGAGVGFFKLKKHKETGKKRVLFRNNSNHKLVVNSNLFNEMEATFDGKVMAFNVQVEGGDVKPLRLRMKTQDEADDIAGKLNDAVDEFKAGR